MSCEADPHTETPDLLIEQSMRLLEVYSARQSAAETKIAGAVTASVALAALTITVDVATTTVLEKVFGGAVLVCVVLKCPCGASRSVVEWLAQQRALATLK